MIFEWDAAKNEKNKQARGLSFEVAPHALRDVIEAKIDRRQDYGETRVIAKCRYRGSILIVVYTMRGDRCRIISVRRANKREGKGS
ncbi:MAG TPA: BrnT family toxin [Alphaproteobacteria bacterium]|nr:BrnT family toxin [Alphaproteobacteria bacterium]